MTEQSENARVTGKLAELDKQDATLTEKLGAQSERNAVLEERMNTRHAETESAMDRLRADLAQRDVDAAKRDTRLMLVIVGTIVAVGSLATAVLGVIITAA